MEQAFDAREEVSQNGPWLIPPRAGKLGKVAEPRY
jgi:hypothetical protein